jgi:hypothetical protein
VDKVARALLAAHKDTEKNIPESPETLKLQRQMLMDGQKSVMMFPAGTGEAMPVPFGMKALSVPEGVFHYNPKQMTPERIKAAIKEGRLNDILGLGPYSKKDVGRRVKKGEPLLNVVGKTPQGHEIVSAAGTPSTAMDQVHAISPTLPEGSEVHVEPIQNVLIQRALRAAAHQR